MAYLLDTNHWIFLLKGRFPALEQKLDTVNPSDVRFCSIVKEELYYGAHKHANRQARLTLLEDLFARHASADFDDAAAAEAARLRQDLERRGELIGPHDLQIAAIALVQGWVLVTNNTRDFQRIAGLPLEDWTQERGRK